MFEDLIPELQGPAADLVQAAAEAGLQPRVTSTKRTLAQQTRLYRRWQSGLSQLPAAPPGTSAHEFGYAFDMVVEPYEALADVGYTWKTWGGVWGESDPVHFEYPGFVRPTVEQSVQETSTTAIGRAATTAARYVSDLPWWLQLFFPVSAMTKEVSSEEETRIRKRACQLFGLGC